MFQWHASLRHAVHRMQDQAPPHLTIMHYTELLDEKGLVLAKADAISPHLISVAEVCNFAQRTLDTSLHFMYCCC